MAGRNVGLQILRGLAANIPTLFVGELYFTTDTKSLFIGTSTGNFQISGPAVQQSWITGVTPGTNRNNYTGFVGIAFTMAQTVTVYQLGRFKVSGNIGTHTVKLVRASTGVDIVGGSVSIPMTPGTAGTFTYGALLTPVVLSAGVKYYLMTQETSGADHWYDYDTVVTETSIAAANDAVYGTSAPYTEIGVANQQYGPVSFKYA